jgi:NAD(P)-dependent dehydrogenase (short-subunit alcohol dehydrogenase family)
VERFQDKVVIVTGGGAGIGRTYAHRFAAEGAAVVVADLDPDAADRVVAELAAAGGRGLAHEMDVTDTAGAARLAERTVAELGGVDVLMNNAGVHLDHAQLPFTLEAVRSGAGSST